MSFSNLPWGWAAAGALLLAGVFYLLQRLRVRHQLVEVETTLFWQQAMEESRARVLTQRFRHPWAYALIVLISLLLWFAVAGLRGSVDAQRDHVVLIDGSAAMAIGNRFDEAVALASDYAGSLPEDARTVVVCGGRARTVLRPGEEVLLLQRRLDGAEPEACRSTIAAAVRQFAAARAERKMTICVVGEHALTQDALDLLPEAIEVQQLRVAPRAGDNRGILALGVRAASSGRWPDVDVLVEVSGAEVPAISLDGTAWAGAPEKSTSGEGSIYRFADVPASGQMLAASLSGGDALAFDDRAQFVLPDRRPIAVAVQPGVAEVVAKVLEADGGVVVQPAVDAETRAVVRRVGSDFGSALPALELSSAEQAEDAFLAFHREGLDPAAVLDELYRGLGLNEIDAMSTAAALGKPVTMGAKPGTQRGLWLWQELLQPDYDFVSSRSFPLFVGLTVRWLAGFDEGPHTVAVGDPVAHRDAVVSHEGVGDSRSFGQSFVPTLAGTYAVAGADGAEPTRFAASLLDRAVSGAGNVPSVELPAAAIAAASGYDLVTLLLVLALLLLVVEWLLFRTSRIP